MQKDDKFNNCTFKISKEHFSIIDKIGLSPNFLENIFPTLINLKNEERNFCLDREEFPCFINKYYYSINNLLLSLNSYLLDNYLELNRYSPEDDFMKIYKKNNKVNSITNLFFYHIKKQTKNIYPECYLILCELFIYENLYRHQISHGWIRVFKNINFNSMDIQIINNDFLDLLVNNPDENNNQLFNLKKEDFDKLREVLKEAKYNTLFFDNFISSDEYEIIREPVFQTKIKKPKTNNVLSKNINKYNLNTLHYRDNFDVLNITFSLNNLIRTILNVVKIIDYCPTLKEHLEK